LALSAYFDESGTDAGNPAIVVAGFGSSIEQWDRFDEEWSAVREEYGAPPFKAKEFDDARRGFGFYSEWPKPKRESYLNRLLGIIRRRTFKSFGTVLEKVAYDQAIAPNPQRRNFFYTPYSFAAVNCVFGACDWRNAMHPLTPMLFYFDEGHCNEGELLKVAKEALIGADRMIQDVQSGDDVKLSPLQAADLLAFELCSEKRNVDAKKTRWTRYPLLELSELPHDWVLVDTAGLDDYIKQLISNGHLPPELPR
jgi:hypothetical protein